MVCLTLEISTLVIFYEIRRQLETSVNFGFQSKLLDCLLGLDLINSFLVVCRNFPFHLQVVADLHLVFNQIFGLGEVANEFLSFFAFQMANPCLMDDAGNF